MGRARGVIGALLLAALLVVSWRNRFADHGAVTETRKAAVARPVAQSAVGTRGIAMKDAAGGTSTQRPPAGLSRTETVTWITQLYQREQLSRELELEQQRYGASYWEPERGPGQMAAVEAERQALLRQLADEANHLLHELFPGDAGDAIAFPRFFDAEHPGPYIAFLSPASRAAFEAALLNSPRADPEALVGLAERVLPRAELDTYRQWNGVGVAATRQLLLGFAASEAEFRAVLDANRADAGPTQDFAPFALQTQLGPARFEEYQRLLEPATQTAVRDLYRLGAPVTAAPWLAAARETATQDAQAVLSDAALSAAEKQSRLAVINRAYHDAVAAKLSLRANSLDELEPGP